MTKLVISVISAVARGTVLANNWTLLVENGDHLTLSNDWVKFYTEWTALAVRWLDALSQPQEFVWHQHWH